MAEEVPKKTTKKDTAEVIELTEALQRLQAEFENYRKREEKERLQVKKRAYAAVLKRFLPFVDSFELAMKNPGVSSDELLKGLELLYAQLASLLEQEKVQKIDPLHEHFDPATQEVLLSAYNTDYDDRVVLEVLQPGYMYDDIVLRTAKVKVNKKEDI